MSLAKRDFEDFVKWIHSSEAQAPSNVRRFANLVLQNFDAIAETSRNRSQRAIRLAGLAQQQLANISDGLPAIVSTSGSITWPWKRLNSLKVGPFRGFRFTESFDLQNRFILFYGPNGAGKTSLCEALEYAMLGSVGEAEAKRISDAAYLPNIHENRFEPPVLTAVDHAGNETDVETNDSIYRFCFIEKNRIDSFSRIAAKPPAQRNELIATLFGMEQFNEFVANFNESIESQLALAKTNQTLLLANRASLAQDQITVDNEVAQLQALDEEELALACSYNEGITYQQLKDLIGQGDVPSRLKDLNSMLDAIPPPILGVTRDDLIRLYHNAKAAHSELDRLTSQLIEKADQVSFKALYTSLIELKDASAERCPACDTPLSGPSSVVTNPFQKAEAGLLLLADLATLQERQKNALYENEQTSRAFKLKLEALRQFVATNAQANHVVIDYLNNLSNTTTSDWWLTIDELESESSESMIEALLAISDLIEQQDESASLAIAQRQEYLSERERLLQYQLKVQAQESKREHLQRKISEARERIQSFDKQNAELIALVEQEIAGNQRDSHIKEAYDLFLSSLRRYLTNLPGTLIAGLNEQAMLLYNQFNRDDRDEDKLAALYLPLKGEEKIEISFCSNSQHRVDALKILSEGHIRCLGLAILLAKNLLLGSPVVIFDDAINAIDHDHRRGIRETIFHSDTFASKQIIVTCHSNEFINDIYQSLPRPAREDSKIYTFLTHQGNYHPKIKRDEPSRNYVDKARRARNERNEREALDASRKALEVFTNKIWKWLGNNQHGLIKVLVPGVGAEPALRNLCEALNAKLKDAKTFAHDDKAPVLEAFSLILGIPETNLVWVYLNKGTHAELNRDDFDGSIVESVVETLEKLERLNFR